VIGTIVEKYEVLEKVGEGGMATVYRGRHTTLDRTVAVKVLHPHLSSSEKNRTRFAREARAIEALTHPNILKIFDYSGPGSEQCFIVTEFIDGPTLRELLDDVGAMMPEPAALIGRELCRALETAHDHGIVHRDIKPENVMLQTRSGEVKLMDFGIARLLDDTQVTMTGALVGSPAYMSPEQATTGAIDRRSDLFSLGTVLYRMVTGTLPFRGSNPSVVLKNIIDVTYEDPAERVPSLDPALASIICKCLSKEPDDRYASAVEVRQALEQFLASVGIDPLEPGHWSIQDYVDNADEYEDRLRDHLLVQLVSRGRAEAERGQTAAALRTFNRVLALDEDNEEVVEIIAGMRPAPSRQDRGGSKLLYLVPVLIAAAAIAGLAGPWNRPTAEPTPPPRPEYRRMRMMPIASVPAPEPRGAPERAPVPEATPTPPRVRPQVNARAERVEGPGTVMPTLEIREDSPEPTPTATPEPVAIAPQFTGYGFLKVPNSGTQWFDVFIDGQPIGSTPLNGERVAAGQHRLRATSPFTEDYEATITVLPEDQQKLTEISIPKRYLPATLRFEGFAEGAMAYVNGREIGAAAAVRHRLTEFGVVDVVVKVDGAVVYNRPVSYGLETGQVLPGHTETIRPDGP
jgi:serine/threonine protein kinase